MKLNGGRHVTGVLRGFDPFMNLVLDEAIEEASAQQKNNIGMVVSSCDRICQILEQSTWLVQCSVPCFLKGCDKRKNSQVFQIPQNKTTWSLQ